MVFPITDGDFPVRYVSHYQRLFQDDATLSVKSRSAALYLQGAGPDVVWSLHLQSAPGVRFRRRYPRGWHLESQMQGAHGGEWRMNRLYRVWQKRGFDASFNCWFQVISLVGNLGPFRSLLLVSGESFHMICSPIGCVQFCCVQPCLG